MSDDISFFSMLQPTSAMFVRLKESKTDHFRVGHTISIRGTGTPLCPILAIKRYLAIRLNNSTGSLFITSTGKPISYPEQCLFAG